MIKMRVEKHRVKKGNEHYEFILNICKLCKNLYNHANYVIKKELEENEKAISTHDLRIALREDTEYPDFRNIPYAEIAYDVLDVLQDTWKGYYKAIKDWKKHPEKYKGMPRTPGFKPKDGVCTFTVRNGAKLKDGVVRFPKVFNGFTIQTGIGERPDFVAFKVARLKPTKFAIVVELVYAVEVPDEVVEDNGRYIAIDLGVNNMCALVNNFDETPVLINGRPLKSINQFYNKQISHYQSIAKTVNGLDYTNRMYRITEKRNRRMDDGMHKISRWVVEYAHNMGVSAIIIGKNDRWKQNVDFGSVGNQNFVFIPHARLIDMITYKCEAYGIKVILTEEDYTSGTSVLDNEPPEEKYYNPTRRITRGVFRANDGRELDADINGACQILKKVYPTVFDNGVSDKIFTPQSITIT